MIEVDDVVTLRARVALLSKALAAETARVEELEAVLALFPTHRCEGCGDWLFKADLFSVDGSDRAAHDRPNSDGSPGYCGPASMPKEIEEALKGARDERS